MGTYNVHVPEHLELMASRRSKDLSVSIVEDLTVLYKLINLTGEGMEEYFTKEELSLLWEVFKNDEFDPERITEWPALLAWDMEDVEKYEKISAQFHADAQIIIEKLEALTPMQALWLLNYIRRSGEL